MGETSAMTGPQRKRSLQDNSTLAQKIRNERRRKALYARNIPEKYIILRENSSSETIK